MHLLFKPVCPGFSLPWNWLKILYHSTVCTWGNDLAALQVKALKSRRETNTHKVPGVWEALHISPHLIFGQSSLVRTVLPRFKALEVEFMHTGGFPKLHCPSVWYSMRRQGKLHVWAVRQFTTPASPAIAKSCLMFRYPHFCLPTSNWLLTFTHLKCICCPIVTGPGSQSDGRADILLDT